MNSKEAPESLIQYPCDFPIKVMGKATPEFLPAVVHIAKQFDSGFQEGTIEQRPSRDANYLVHVHSREQLDEIYRTLSTHPLVSVVL
jgi:putative lipoic acid-binding regulatory protein